MLIFWGKFQTVDITNSCKKIFRVSYAPITKTFVVENNIFEHLKISDSIHRNQKQIIFCFHCCKKTFAAINFLKKAVRCKPGVEKGFSIEKKTKHSKTDRKL